LQNRIGASIFQPLFDLLKFYSKGETVSEVTSWIFRSSAGINFALVLIIALLVPWVQFKPHVASADIFLVIYLFAFMRMMTVLAALDAGSAFGGFGASREVTLALLIEPALVLCLASLGVVSRTSDLEQIFSFANLALSNQPGLWLLAGSGLFLTSLVELSRMPVDDPTTHLELTMVHEAMILENSGRNLLLVEYTHALKLLVLFGLSAQCFLHAIAPVWQLPAVLISAASGGAVLITLALVGVQEGLSVKLRWTRLPEFIAYAVTMALLSVLVAIAGRLGS